MENASAAKDSKWKGEQILSWFCPHCREIQKGTFNEYRKHVEECDGPYARED